MPGPSRRLVVLALIAACGPSGSLPGTGTEPGAASTTADDSPPVTTTSTGGMTTGSATDSGTTQSRPTTGDGDGTTQPRPTTGDGDGTTQSRTTTGLTEPVDTTAPGSSGTDTTTTGETGDSSTSTTHDIPDTTGGELCEGAPDEADLTWSLEVSPALADQDITASCEVVSADDMGQAVTVHLSCVVQGKVEDVVLHYALTPERDLVWDPGASAELTYRTEDAPWGREWLTLHTGLTRLWAVRADALAPPGVEVEGYYGRPIAIVAPCDPQPDPCGQRQGLEVRISYDFGDIPTHLALRSGQWGIYGFPVPTIVWLEHASRLLDPGDCDDVAPLQLDMVLVDDASGF